MAVPVGNRAVLCKHFPEGIQVVVKPNFPTQLPYPTLVLPLPVPQLPSDTSSIPCPPTYRNLLRMVLKS